MEIIAVHLTTTTTTSSEVRSQSLGLRWALCVRWVFAQLGLIAVIYFNGLMFFLKYNLGLSGRRPIHLQGVRL